MVKSNPNFGPSFSMKHVRAVPANLTILWYPYHSFLTGRIFP